MAKIPPSQRLLKRFEERLALGDLDLSDIIRGGAQLMLQYALEREVSEALGRGYYENDPEVSASRGRRSGYETRTVLTGEGEVTVDVPQVRETSEPFKSSFLDAYLNRTETLDALITRMYVDGMSTRDIESALRDVLGGRGVSRSVVSRITERLHEDFQSFRARDLAKEDLLYLELDGTYLRYHLDAERKEPMLVATGYGWDGTRVLLHISPG
ncbi:MAG: IS256 family transposase, partial [bacterium]|nr:IS256 family transposase [bacterium]